MRRKRKAAADKLFQGLFSHPGVEHFPTAMTSSVRLGSGSVPGTAVMFPARLLGSRCPLQAQGLHHCPRASPLPVPLLRARHCGGY